MKKLFAVILALALLRAGPALAQQCIDGPTFKDGAKTAGYEPVWTAKDGDGDTLVMFVNGKTLNRIVVFVPRQAPDVVCSLGTGTEFKVLPNGSI